MLSDSQELGGLRPLGELSDSRAGGLNTIHHAHVLRPVGDEGEPPVGFVPVIGGREVQPGRAGRKDHAVAAEKIEQIVQTTLSRGQLLGNSE